jgi:hypothetical protein
VAVIQIDYGAIGGELIADCTPEIFVFRDFEGGVASD